MSATAQSACEAVEAGECNVLPDQQLNAEKSQQQKLPTKTKSSASLL